MSHLAIVWKLYYLILTLLTANFESRHYLKLVIDYNYLRIKINCNQVIGIEQWEDFRVRGQGVPDVLGFTQRKIQKVSQIPSLILLDSTGVDNYTKTTMVTISLLHLPCHV